MQMSIELIIKWFIHTSELEKNIIHNTVPALVEMFLLGHQVYLPWTSHWPQCLPSCLHHTGQNPRNHTRDQHKPCQRTLCVCCSVGGTRQQTSLHASSFSRLQSPHTVKEFNSGIVNVNPSFFLLFSFKVFTTVVIWRPLLPLKTTLFPIPWSISWRLTKVFFFSRL